MQHVNTAYLSLGSNQGDRLAQLENAIDQLKAYGQITARSSVYETAAWGLEDQPHFLNMAVCLHTDLTGMELLTAIQHIEAALGRKRTIKWGQRTMDIDILMFNNEVSDSKVLTLPHPFMHLRRFVLAPLAEIAAGVRHPVSGKTIAELLAVCPDGQAVSLWKEAG